MKTRLLALAVLAGTASAQLTIHYTFDPSVTSNPNSAAIQNAMNYIAQQLQTAYSDPITINITVVAAPGTSVFGQSSTALIGTYTYSQIRGFLSSHATTADDTSALASLPVADPTAGATFWLTTAQAKALGQRSGTNPSTDGTFTFGAGHTFTFNPANRAVPGAFDFIGVAQHEVTEIMGRIAGLDHSNELIQDLFRFSASGVHSFSPSATGIYFSVNNGATSLRVFNSTAGGDLGDWNSATPDACNAFVTSNAVNDLSETDLRMMDVMGYRRVIACYANCDRSTTTPVLNVQDFTCFLNKFAAGDTYANCDNSTTAPVLNVQDFTCFLNKFTAGCS